MAARGNVHLPTIGNIYTYWLIGRKDNDNDNDIDDADDNDNDRKE